MAIRGAIQIAADTSACITVGTMTLLRRLLSDNALTPKDVVSLLFTMTPDLSADLPPLVVRDDGWSDVPMLCAAELRTPLMTPKTVRVLAHVRVRGPVRLMSVYLPDSLRNRPAPTTQPLGRDPLSAGPRERVS